MFPFIFTAVTLAYVVITGYETITTLRELIFARKVFLKFVTKAVGISWPTEVNLISILPIDHNC